MFEIYCLQKHQINQGKIQVMSLDDLKCNRLEDDILFLHDPDKYLYCVQSCSLTKSEKTGGILKLDSYRVLPKVSLDVKKRLFFNLKPRVVKTQIEVPLEAPPFSHKKNTTPVKFHVCSKSLQQSESFNSGNKQSKKNIFEMLIKPSHTRTDSTPKASIKKTVHLYPGISSRNSRIKICGFSDTSADG